MYTGTLIRDLMATVELAVFRAEQQRLSDEQELRAIFAMQIPVEGDHGVRVQLYQGAA